MTWTRHNINERHLLWVEEGVIARGVSVTPAGVKPRLTQNDHAVKRVLRSLDELYTYVADTNLDEDAQAVLLAAFSALVSWQLFDLGVRGATCVH